MKSFNADISKILELSLSIVVAFSLSMYGLGKPLQFSSTALITDSVNSLSGMKLMWAFYGYSRTYVIIIGILQILGSIMLVFNNTRIIACFLLSTILVNIILQDVFYHVNKGALFAAIFYQFCILIILFINKVKLYNLYLSYKNNYLKNLKLDIKIILVSILFAAIIKAIEIFFTH